MSPHNFQVSGEMSPRKKYNLIQAYFFRPGSTLRKQSWFYINFTARQGLLYVVNNYFLSIQNIKVQDDKYCAQVQNSLYPPAKHGLHAAVQESA